MKQRLFAGLIYALLFALLGAATTASWLWRRNNPAVQPSDCVAVAGALYSAQKWSSGDHENLDLYLRGNPICFRVPTDNNGADFDAATFLKRQTLGSKVTVYVRKSELRAPFYGWGSSAPLIWVSGLRDARTVYYSIAQARGWDINNRRLELYAAWAFTLITAGCFIAFVVAKLRGADLTAPAKPEPPMAPQQRLTIGLMQLFAGSMTILIMLGLQRAFFPSRSAEIFLVLNYPALIAVFGFFRTLIAWRDLRRQRNSRL